MRNLFMANLASFWTETEGAEVVLVNLPGHMLQAQCGLHSKVSFTRVH